MGNSKINHGRLNAALIIAAVAFAPHILTLREKWRNTEQVLPTEPTVTKGDAGHGVKDGLPLSTLGGKKR